jgi:hypothetical protein
MPLRSLTRASRYQVGIPIYIGVKYLPSVRVFFCGTKKNVSRTVLQTNNPRKQLHPTVLSLRGGTTNNHIKYSNSRFQQLKRQFECFSEERRKMYREQFFNPKKEPCQIPILLPFLPLFAVSAPNCLPSHVQLLVK